MSGALVEARLVVDMTGARRGEPGTERRRQVWLAAPVALGAGRLRTRTDGVSGAVTHTAAQPRGAMAPCAGASGVPTSGQ